jgi:RNA polymerase sigma-70 factor (ECF subfamily)
LLTQLRQDPSDQTGWDEFVDRYGRHIYRWCRQWKLQDADAEDVTQDILVKLTQKLRAFAYDPSRSFRGWLKTVAHHAWRDFEDSRRRAQATAGDSQAQEQMLTLEAREDLARWKGVRSLLGSQARVRRVAAATWERSLVALEGCRPPKWRQIHMQVAMVYVARAKSKIAQEEIRNSKWAWQRPCSSRREGSLMGQCLGSPGSNFMTFCPSDEKLTGLLAAHDAGNRMLRAARGRMHSCQNTWPA